MHPVYINKSLRDLILKPLPMVTVEGIEYGIVYFGKNVTFESFDIFEAWANVVEMVVVIVVAIVVEFILGQLKLKLKIKSIVDTTVDRK